MACGFHPACGVQFRVEAGPAPNLTASYLGAVYRVQDPRGRWRAFTFDPGSDPPGDDPDSLGFAPPWIIITAWNPCSTPRSDEQNRAAHCRLLRAAHDLHRHTHPTESCDPAHAGDPSRAWREEGLLIEHVPIEMAAMLLRVFRQNAGVYCARGRIGLLFADTLALRIYPMRMAPAEK